MLGRRNWRRMRSIMDRPMASWMGQAQVSSRQMAQMMTRAATGGPRMATGADTVHLVRGMTNCVSRRWGTAYSRAGVSPITIA